MNLVLYNYTYSFPCRPPLFTPLLSLVAVYSFRKGVRHIVLDVYRIGWLLALFLLYTISPPIQHQSSSFYHLNIFWVRYIFMVCISFGASEWHSTCSAGLISRYPRCSLTPFTIFSIAINL
ncbi:hypothetical protein L228DRAFT_53399 [Xylona heveae TC161]|uniref:Uncharacterized protein n=1 Tax=Xylona heveae (strain CBS 132557 / TC161) TaxID=1328760 RepID=A0A164ZGG9_XYLHT|nr:hypothetical protein L228DRAFT_53399 [Xylona heveae TC161]KZF19075.1 hypothetical protein L228DRAFT_53399 [Xylona heveae TC161]